VLPAERSFTALREKLERRILPYVLWLSAAAYVLLRFIDKELKLEGWEFPLILVTLALMLHIVDLTRSDVLEESIAIRADAKDIRKQLQSSNEQMDRRLKDIASSVKRGERWLEEVTATLKRRSYVRVYDTTDAYFRGLKIAVEQATSRVWVTYVREQPPDEQSEEAREYFAYCDEWMKRPGHNFRRLVYYELDNKPMRAWITKESSKSHHMHYSIRVRLGTPRDKISVGLIDNRLVFCAFAGERDDIQGFSIEEPALVQHFRAYLTRLWDMSETSEDIARRVNAKAPTQSGGPHGPETAQG
jgi:hypothetical protein